MFMFVLVYGIGICVDVCDVVCVVDVSGVVCDVECCVVYRVWVLIVVLLCSVVGVGGVWCGVKTQDY